MQFPTVFQYSNLKKKKKNFDAQNYCQYLKDGPMVIF